jgi:hypothetical protein
MRNGIDCRRKQLILIRLALTCVALGVSAFVSAQIVECIDANGKKVYTQNCPAGTVKQRDIQESAPVSSKSTPSNDASKQKQADQEKAFEQRRAERLKAAAATEEKEKAEEEAQRTCADDQRRLDLLEAGRRFKRVDPDTGEHVSMDENQRQDEINRLTEQIAACR